jgi:hypothetical protein
MAVKLPSFSMTARHKNGTRDATESLRIRCALADMRDTRNKLERSYKYISKMSLLCNSEDAPWLPETKINFLMRVVNVTVNIYAAHRAFSASIWRCLP